VEGCDELVLLLEEGAHPSFVVVLAIDAPASP